MLQNLSTKEPDPIDEKQEIGEFSGMSNEENDEQDGCPGIKRKRDSEKAQPFDKYEGIFNSVLWKAKTLTTNELWEGANFEVTEKVETKKWEKSINQKTETQKIAPPKAPDFKKCALHSDIKVAKPKDPIILNILTQKPVKESSFPTNLNINKGAYLMNPKTDSKIKQGEIQKPKDDVPKNSGEMGPVICKNQKSVFWKSHNEVTNNSMNLEPKNAEKPNVSTSNPPVQKPNIPFGIQFPDPKSMDTGPWKTELNVSTNLNFGHGNEGDFDAKTYFWTSREAADLALQGKLPMFKEATSSGDDDFWDTENEMDYEELLELQDDVIGDFHSRVWRANSSDTKTLNTQFQEKCDTVDTEENFWKSEKCDLKGSVILEPEIFNSARESSRSPEILQFQRQKANNSETSDLNTTDWRSAYSEHSMDSDATDYEEDNDYDAKRNLSMNSINIEPKTEKPKSSVSPGNAFWNMDPNEHAARVIGAGPEFRSSEQITVRDMILKNTTQNPTELQKDSDSKPKENAPKRYVYPFIPEPASTKPLKLKAPEKTYEGEMSKDPSIARRQCKMCYKIFSKKDKLMRHATAHQTQAEAICGICEAPIKHRFNMKPHLLMCLEEMVEDMDEEKMKELYPAFYADLERWRRDPALPPIKLPDGFTMNKMGLVNGFDLGLIGKFKFNAPKFNPEFNQDEVFKMVQDGDD